MGSHCRTRHGTAMMPVTQRFGTGHESGRRADEGHARPPAASFSCGSPQMKATRSGRRRGKWAEDSWGRSGETAVGMLADARSAWRVWLHEMRAVTRSWWAEGDWPCGREGERCRWDIEGGEAEGCARASGTILLVAESLARLELCLQFAITGSAV